MGRSERADLWSDVVRSSAERPRRSVADDAFLAHAEVRDLDMSLRVEHHVVQLQISAHHATYQQSIDQSINRSINQSINQSQFLQWPK